MRGQMESKSMEVAFSPAHGLGGRRNVRKLTWCSAGRSLSHCSPCAAPPRTPSIPPRRATERQNNELINMP